MGLQPQRTDSLTAKLCPRHTKQLPPRVRMKCRWRDVQQLVWSFWHHRDPSRPGNQPAGRASVRGSAVTKLGFYNENQNGLITSQDVQRKQKSLEKLSLLETLTTARVHRFQPCMLGTDCHGSAPAEAAFQEQQSVRRLLSTVFLVQWLLFLVLVFNTFSPSLSAFDAERLSELHLLNTDVTQLSSFFFF